jgi:hypothetical protein
MKAVDVLRRLADHPVNQQGVVLFPVLLIDVPERDTSVSINGKKEAALSSQHMSSTSSHACPLKAVFIYYIPKHVISFRFINLHLQQLDRASRFSLQLPKRF